MNIVLNSPYSHKIPRIYKFLYRLSVEIPEYEFVEEEADSNVEEKSEEETEEQED